MDAEETAYWDEKFLLWLENLKPATPAEMEGLTRKALATAECILDLFQKGMPVSAIAESCALPLPVIEWWLCIGLMPSLPYPFEKSGFKKSDHKTDCGDC
jgi:hypothetical protein